MLSLTNISETLSYHRRYDKSQILQVMRHITESFDTRFRFASNLFGCYPWVLCNFSSSIKTEIRSGSEGGKILSTIKTSIVWQPGRVKTGLLVCSHSYLGIRSIFGEVGQLFPFYMNVNTDIHLPAHAVCISTDVTGYL